jgi:tagatose 6-phosphate kinase
VIVTVTLDPSLDVRYDADDVQVGGTNQVSRVRYAAGGRGLAVARLLHMFGHEVVAAGLAGGAAGSFIRNDLSRDGVASQFTAIEAESRRVMRIRDTRAGLATSFVEPSPYITTEELGRLAADYRGLLDGATAVVLAGGLPDGLPVETYGSLASYAAQAGVPVVLNAGGSALRHGAARGPALVIPEPADDLAGLEATGGTSVALATERGARVLTAAGEWQAQLGASEAGPGSSDALVAGFVPGVALAWSWPDMLRHAVALAAATTDGEPDLARYERVLPAVAVTRCDASGRGNARR